MYTVYRVTNQITQDFYIGVHKTEDPQDDYLGSGKEIRQQVALHGPENFTKEILLITEVKREAYQKEEESIRPFLRAPGCLNLHPGGHGGFGYLNRPGGAGDIGRQRARDSQSHLKARQVYQEMQANDPAYAAKQQEIRRNNLAAHRSADQCRRAQVLATAAWRGQQHSADARVKMSEKTQGPLNGAFGTCWIHLPGTGEAMRVPRQEAEDQWIPRGWAPGRHSKQVKKRTKAYPHTCSGCGRGSTSALCGYCSAAQEHARLAKEVVALATAGTSTLEIASMLPVSRRTVYRMLHAGVAQ